MRRLLYAGSFDPVTFGHLDIIRRAADLCDELLVGIAVNTSKHALFTVDERVMMLEESIPLYAHTDKVKVIKIDGLTVDAALVYQATLVRGIRNSSDLDVEQQMDAINKELTDVCVDTIYLMADRPWISSSAVKTLAKMGAKADERLCAFTPINVAEKTVARMKALQGLSEPRQHQTHIDCHVDR